MDSSYSRNYRGNICDHCFCLSLNTEDAAESLLLLSLAQTLYCPSDDYACDHNGNRRKIWVNRGHLFSFLLLHSGIPARFTPLAFEGFVWLWLHLKRALKRVVQTARGFFVTEGVI